MRYPAQQSGVSLIELMVGLVIGLVALLVIGQTMAVFEGEKRTSTGGADAQTNGYMALLAMERDIREAGSGMVDAKGRLVCEQATKRQYNGTQELPASSPPNEFLPPIRIIAGGSGTGGDAIVMVRANVNYGGALPSTLQAVWAGASNCVTEGALQEPTANDASRGEGDLFLISPVAKPMSDLAVAPPPVGPHCYLVQASAKTDVSACAPIPPFKYLTLATAPTKPYNNGVLVPVAQGGDLVIALGPSPYIRYGVNDNKLMLAEQMAFVANGSAYVSGNRFADDIVYVAAQYGIDTDCVSTMAEACGGVDAQSVNRYVAPTGVWAQTALTPARFGRIKAIRLAVVARSQQYNRDLVSPATITLWQKINAGDDAPPVFSGAALDQHYRYRVFETVIPLKNMIWGQL